MQYIYIYKVFLILNVILLILLISGVVLSPFRRHFIAVLSIFVLIFFLIDFDLNASSSDIHMLDFLNTVMVSYNQHLKTIAPLPPLILSTDQINMILDSCSTKESIIDAVSILFEEHIGHYAELLHYLEYVFSQLNEVWVADGSEPLELTYDYIYNVLTPRCTKAAIIKIVGNTFISAYNDRMFRSINDLTFFK